MDMHKRLVGGFLALLGVISLASCSEGKTERVELSMPKLTDTRGSEVKMNTITTLNGDEVTYNMNTRRIVSLSSSGDLVALGIRPLAVEGFAITDGYEDYFYGVEKLNYSQPFNQEELMTYKPDVIICYDTMDISNIRKLEKIAKEAVIPVYYDEYDFELRLGLLGSIFGLEENARALIDYANKVKSTSEERIKSLGLDGKTVTIFSYYQSGICIPPTYRDGWTFNKILYKDLGLLKTSKVEEYLNDRSSQAYLAISNEKVREYEGDIVLFADISARGSDSTNKVPDNVASNVGWNSLKAVKEDRVGVFNATLFASKDVLYVEMQYKMLVDALMRTIK